MLAAPFSMWEHITWIRKPPSGLFRIDIHQKQVALCWGPRLEDLCPNWRRLASKIPSPQPESINGKIRRAQGGGSRCYPSTEAVRQQARSPATATYCVSISQPIKPRKFQTFTRLDSDKIVSSSPYLPILSKWGTSRGSKSSKSLLLGKRWRHGGPQHRWAEMRERQASWAFPGSLLETLPFK